MTAIAPDSDVTREFHDDLRRAWNDYSARLRGLTGDDYERVERESWAKLQSELRRVERRRRLVAQDLT